MTDFVTPAIARLFGVSSSYIGPWRISAERAGHRCAGGFAQGYIRAQIDFSVAVTVEQYRRLRTAFQNDSALGSIQIAQVDASHGIDLPELKIEARLLYGKQTQHIFKALHQTMTVRGKKK